MQLDPPSNIEDYFPWLKEKSEEYWKIKKLNPIIYGFQIQKGTKWNPGLHKSSINNFEKNVGFQFPEVLRFFLQTMNGTDTPGINIFGSSGHPYTHAPKYYSYPDDIDRIVNRIETVCNSFNIHQSDMDGLKIPYIFPIVEHRFLIIDNTGTYPVLSMHYDDVIPYASSIRTFLINDIFHNHIQEKEARSISVNFWLN